MVKLKLNMVRLIHDTYLADLGRVVAAWSHVESQFHLFYLSIVVMRGQAGSLREKQVQDLMGLPLERQLRKFRERLNEIDLSNDTRAKIDNVFSRLSTLKLERDKVAHSQWTPF